MLQQKSKWRNCCIFVSSLLLTNCSFLKWHLTYLGKSIHAGNMVARPLALPPHSSRIPSLILSLCYCLCGVLCVGFSQVLQCPVTSQKHVGGYPILPGMWMSMWMCVHGTEYILTSCSVIQCNLDQAKAHTEDNVEWFSATTLICINVKCAQGEEMYYHYRKLTNAFLLSYARILL